MHKDVNKVVGKPSLVCVHPAHNHVLRNFLFGLYQLFSGFMGMLVHNQNLSIQSVNQPFIPLSHIAYINYVSIK